MIRSESPVVPVSQVDETIATLAGDRDVLNVTVTPHHATHESRHTHAISELVSTTWVSFLVTVVWLE
jgi:hypothetical protein